MSHTGLDPTRVRRVTIVTLFRFSHAREVPAVLELPIGPVQRDVDSRVPPPTFDTSLSYAAAGPGSGAWPRVSAALSSSMPEGSKAGSEVWRAVA